MQQNLTIAVAMCTYNGQPYLNEQLESIAAQTRLPDHLVVCDDGSKDGSLEVLDKFCKSANFSVTIQRNQKTLGTTRNFEQAISLAQGDIILLADQDDVWHPRKIELIEAAFQQAADVALVLTDAEVVDGELDSLGYTLWQFRKFRKAGHLGGRRALAALLKYNPSYGTTLAFRAKFKDLVLPIPDEVAHDMWTGLLLAAVADLELITTPLVQYRQHPGQQSADRPIEISLRSKVGRAKKSDRLEIRENLYMLELARKLLAERHAANASESLRLMDQKIAHLKRRSTLPEANLARLPTVIREWITFRYSRYSNGSLSAAKDLFF